MAKIKKMCKWGKVDVEKRFDEFTKMVERPKYACTKCGRVARAKKTVCKPKAL